MVLVTPSIPKTFQVHFFRFFNNMFLVDLGDHVKNNEESRPGEFNAHMTYSEQGWKKEKASDIPMWMDGRTTTRRDGEALNIT